MMKSELLAEYGVYQYMPEFHQGWEDYMAGNYEGKPYPNTQVGCQAYDRGMEAAMRWRRQGHKS